MLNKIFEPLKIGNVELKNRLVVPPMVVNYANQDGTASERFISYHEEKAKGGWGLIIVENYAVDKYAGGFKTVPGLWEDAQIKSHKELTDRVHKHNTKIIAQIYHAGRETGSFINGVQPVAPSPIKDPTMDETPRELSISEIKKLVEQFGDTALRAKKAGFDGVELHGAHGYLINQFMSPFSNKRTDEYGGGIQNRARFALEIIENIRKKTGKDFLINYRMSVNEFVERGLTTEDSKAIAIILEKAGINAIHASNGVYASIEYVVPPAAIKHAWSVDIAAEIKSVVSIPVIAVGRINDPLIAESVIYSQKADLVAMGRASLADPHMPNKAKAGRFEDIITCIGCLQGCIGRNGKQLPVKCILNPMTGNEYKFKDEKSKKNKKVVIAGAGIAGMEAAIVASKQGHQVELFEKSNKLGGQWLLAGIPPFKEELNAFTVWQKSQLEKNGVNIHLNRELTEEIVEELAPDALIIATGSKSIIPNIICKKDTNIVTADDVLSGKCKVGQHIAIIGGGLVGTETAAYLANHGKNVTLIEATEKIVKDGEPSVNKFLLDDLNKNDVCILTNALVKEIDKESLVITESDGKESRLENIENVILAVGYKPDNYLADKFKDKVKKIITIGDALKVRKGEDAIEEGFFAGLEI